jgi:hypothetical protein
MMMRQLKCFLKLYQSGLAQWEDWFDFENHDI